MKDVAGFLDDGVQEDAPAVSGLFEGGEHGFPVFDAEGFLAEPQHDLVERLRAERRFDSPEALAVQLEADKEQVKQILG